MTFKIYRWTGTGYATGVELAVDSITCTFLEGCVADVRCYGCGLSEGDSVVITYLRGDGTELPVFTGIVNGSRLVYDDATLDYSRYILWSWSKVFIDGYVSFAWVTDTTTVNDLASRLAGVGGCARNSDDGVGGECLSGIGWLDPKYPVQTNVRKRWGGVKIRELLDSWAKNGIIPMFAVERVSNITQLTREVRELFTVQDANALVSGGLYSVSVDQQGVFRFGRQEKTVKRYMFVTNAGVVRHDFGNVLLDSASRDVVCDATQGYCDYTLRVCGTGCFDALAPKTWYPVYVKGDIKVYLVRNNEIFSELCEGKDYELLGPQEADVVNDNGSATGETVLGTTIRIYGFQGEYVRAIADVGLTFTRSVGAGGGLSDVVGISVEDEVVGVVEAVEAQIASFTEAYEGHAGGFDLWIPIATSTGVEMPWLDFDAVGFYRSVSSVDSTVGLGIGTPIAVVQGAFTFNEYVKKWQYSLSNGGFRVKVGSMRTFVDRDDIILSTRRLSMLTYSGGEQIYKGGNIRPI